MYFPGVPQLLDFYHADFVGDSGGIFGVKSLLTGLFGGLQNAQLVDIIPERTSRGSHCSGLRCQSVARCSIRSGNPKGGTGSPLDFESPR